VNDTRNGEKKFRGNVRRRDLPRRYGDREGFKSLRGKKDSTTENTAGRRVHGEERTTLSAKISEGADLEQEDVVPCEEGRKDSVRVGTAVEETARASECGDRI
jgi:hypothetical protein